MPLSIGHFVLSIGLHQVQKRFQWSPEFASTSKSICWVYQGPVELRHRHAACAKGFAGRIQSYVQSTGNLLVFNRIFEQEVGRA